MTVSRFRLQLIDENGDVVIVAPGSPLEVDLRTALATEITRAQMGADTFGTPAVRQRIIDLATTAVAAQGVGIFASEAKVLAAVERGLAEAFRTVSQEHAADTSDLVADAIHQVFHGLKRRAVALV